MASHSKLFTFWGTGFGFADINVTLPMTPATKFPRPRRNSPATRLQVMFRREEELSVEAGGVLTSPLLPGRSISAQRDYRCGCISPR
jgi:hypothetical protein